MGWCIRQRFKSDFGRLLALSRNVCACYKPNCNTLVILHFNTFAKCVYILKTADQVLNLKGFAN